MNNIIIVTNEINIVDSTLKILYNDPDFVKIENVPYSTGDPYARWIDIVDGERVEMQANPKEGNIYNVLRVPLPGLVYMIAYSRFHELTDDKNMVVCMKELYPTMVFTLEKYHLFLYGKNNVTRHDFDEWFALPVNEEEPINALLNSDYDVFINIAKENRMPLVSEALSNIL